MALGRKTCRRMELVPEWENKFTLTGNYFSGVVVFYPKNHGVLRICRVKALHRPANFFQKHLSIKILGLDWNCFDRQAVIQNIL
jgi:hypothetical protein